MWWTISIGLLLGGAFIAFLNIVYAYRSRIGKGPHSLIPILGGAAMAVGLALHPDAGWRWYWWIPPLADIGCVPLLVCTAIDWIWLRPRRTNDVSSDET